MLINYMFELGEKIGHYNLLFCLTFLIVSSISKTIFDNGSKGMTSKIVNGTALILVLLFWLIGGNIFELIVSALAFQRFFELVGYHLEKAYICIVVKVVEAVLFVWGRFMSLFNARV